MAMLFAGLGKIDSAITEMEKMYQIDPSPSNTLSLAMFYEQKGRASDAGRILDQLLNKSGKNPSVMNDLAYLYAEYAADPRDLEKAADLSAQAIGRQPDNAAFLDTSAWVSFKQGDLNAAWYRILSALALRPEIGSLNFHAAVIANARGLKQESGRYLEKALQENLDSQSRKAAIELRETLN